MYSKGMRVKTGTRKRFRALIGKDRLPFQYWLPLTYPPW
jgi:hypothetical protein